MLVKAAFLLGLLNPSVRGPYRSQSEAGRPQCRSFQSLGLYGVGWGGLGRPQPMLLLLFTKRLEEDWTTPLSTPQYNGKQGSGKILETCTHTCHPLDLEDRPRIIWAIGGGGGGERRWGGELVSQSSWFLNGHEEEEEEKVYVLKTN